MVKKQTQPKPVVKIPDEKIIAPMCSFLPTQTTVPPMPVNKIIKDPKK